MTFLELCQAVRAEAGIQGSGPSTVVGQTGMYGRIVDWVGEAYAEILKMHPWSFLWTRVTPELTSAQAAYTGADFDPAITDLGRIYSGSMKDLTTTNTPKIYFRDWSILDAQAAASGPPRYFTRRPDDAIIFYPTPDAVYEVQFDYLKDGHTLVDNTDTPLIPDATLHKIIVYKALDYYGMYDENQTASLHGGRQFNMMLGQMHAKYGRQLQTAAIALDQETNPNAVELV